jgi:hypothetical protein
VFDRQTMSACHPKSSHQGGTVKLSVKSLTITVAVLWGISFFVVSVANLIWPPYGAAFLSIISSLYPGYESIGTFGSVIVGTLYALVDGAVCGAVFAWLYNIFAG